MMECHYGKAWRKVMTEIESRPAAHRHVPGGTFCGFELLHGDGKAKPGFTTEITEVTEHSSAVCLRTPGSCNGGGIYPDLIGTPPLSGAPMAQGGRISPPLHHPAASVTHLPVAREGLLDFLGFD